MGVKVLEVSPDYRYMHVRLPLRWYGKNMYGTMFGGFICAVTDPLAALLCAKLFPGTQVWSKKHTVDFVRPGRTTVDFKIKVTDEHLAQMDQQLKADSKALCEFRYSATDTKGHLVAEIQSTVYVRYRPDVTKQTFER